MARDGSKRIGHPARCGLEERAGVYKRKMSNNIQACARAASWVIVILNWDFDSEEGFK
jgi:hypothetical protein